MLRPYGQHLFAALVDGYSEDRDAANVWVRDERQWLLGKKSQWAKMDVKANEVRIGGNVVVKQGKTIIKGQKLFVDLDKNISEMTGGRVKGSFTPGNN